LKRPSLPQILQSLYQNRCSLCPLSEESRPIRPRGSWEARTAIIGEGPGRVEEEKDVFFIGPAGAELESCCAGLGMPLDLNFLILNAVQCRPHPPAGATKENRTPAKAEIDACRPVLERMVIAHNPDLLVALGGVAARALLRKPPAAVSRTVGRFFPPGDHNLPVEADLYVAWHPAYILRNPNERPAFMRQLTRLRDYMLGRGILRRE
jgi:DNA polymerase